MKDRRERMNDRDKQELDLLLAVFRDQTLQILDEMGQDLLALESGADEEAKKRLRRGAHTIKGDSACVGLDNVTALAHEIETAFDAALGGQRVINRQYAAVIFKALDAIRESVGGERIEDLDSVRGAQLVEELSRVRSGDQTPEFVRPPQGGGLDSGQAKAAASPSTDPGKLRRDHVRVEAAKVDALLDLASEMVISRSVISQIGSELELALPRSELAARFAGASHQMGNLVGELQKAALKMRMVTIDQVFRRFVRLTRELAAECNKLVRLEMSGGGTELDRALVDALYEPLLHLVRNAVDHGIEPPPERLAAGKPEIGTLTIRAYHEGNQVVVQVKDDGRGIDSADLKSRAVRAGAITREEADVMPDEEAVNLIFLEGLSTAKELTRLSGRGIGAAAVWSAVEQLRGTVVVNSEPGAGTSFTLRMPLTLAIIRALLFKASGQLFALPLLAVSEIARARASEIIPLNGLEHYRLRDRFISVVRPGVALSFDRRKGGSGALLRQEHFFIIVLANRDRHFGIVADELAGEQELVIKPLDSQWVQNDALAGASVLGDGRVVLIMDSESVFRKAIKYERRRENPVQTYAV